MSQPGFPERLAIVGGGAVACGLARLAVEQGAPAPLVLVRSGEAAERARGALGDGARIATDPQVLAEATFVVEAVVEEHGPKAEVYRGLAGALAGEAIVATATSSLDVSGLAEASGRPERFAGFHVFNPVERMKLVELAFPAQATDDTRARTRALAEALGKTPVEVPDEPGFVVNRLLFPFLFDAVRLMERTGMAAEDVDRCMKLGAGHPMGPLTLLDFVGLDVAAAIGEQIGADVPERLRSLAADGRLGRKSGAGFYRY